MTAPPHHLRSIASVTLDAPAESKGDRDHRVKRHGRRQRQRPRPATGFHAPIRRDKRLTKIVEALEASPTPIDCGELAAVLLDWSPGEYADPPLPEPAIALTHEARKQLYRLRAAKGFALFHPGDLLDSDHWGRQMVKTKGQAAHEAGYISLRCEQEDYDNDDASDDDDWSFWAVNRRQADRERSAGEPHGNAEPHGND